MLIIPVIPLRLHQKNIWRMFMDVRKKLLKDVKNKKITNGLTTFVLNAHRRSGKDILAFCLLIHQAYWEKGNYLYVFPYL